MFVVQAQISLKENQPTASPPQGKIKVTKKPRAPRKPKTNPRQQEVPLQPSFVEDYSSLLQDYQLAQQFIAGK